MLVARFGFVVGLTGEVDPIRRLGRRVGRVREREVGEIVAGEGVGESTEDTHRGGGGRRRGGREGKAEKGRVGFKVSLSLTSFFLPPPPAIHPGTRERKVWTHEWRLAQIKKEDQHDGGGRIGVDA